MIKRHKQGRFWAVYDPNGALVCVCVYKRGALEVLRRLASSGGFNGPSATGPVAERDTLGNRHR